MKTKLMMRRFCRAILGLVASVAVATPAGGQVARSDSLEQWVRRGYVLENAESREIWRELGWNGVGFGFRSFGSRQPVTGGAFDQSIALFAASMEYYRIKLDELHTKIDGEIGLAWGVHTEVFQVKGQPAESIRVRFTNTLRWDGRTWKNLLYHRDAQRFDANGRYSRSADR